MSSQWAPERLCACGCKRSLEGKRKSAIYYEASCRTRAWKQRHRIIGIRYTKASQNGKSRSGVQISYPATRLAVARDLAITRHLAEDAALAEAERILLPVIPARQRARLEQRQEAT